MTDSPRFRPLEPSFEYAYQRYHGANLVASVLSCAERWTAWRKRRALAGSNAQAVQTQLSRDAGTSFLVGGADGERGGATFASHTHTNDQ